MSRIKKIIIVLLSSIIIIVLLVVIYSIWFYTVKHYHSMKMDFIEQNINDLYEDCQFKRYYARPFIIGYNIMGISWSDNIPVLIPLHPTGNINASCNELNEKIDIWIVLFNNDNITNKYYEREHERHYHSKCNDIGIQNQGKCLYSIDSDSFGLKYIYKKKYLVNIKLFSDECQEVVTVKDNYCYDCIREIKVELDSIITEAETGN